jgi:hypothetical protein
MITLQTRTGKWVIERRPAPRDRFALVRDRTLRDLVDALDDAIVVVNADNAYTPHQIEFISGVLDGAFKYLSDLREQQTQVR